MLLTYSMTCNILSDSSQLGTKCQGSVENLFCGDYVGSDSLGKALFIVRQCGSKSVGGGFNF